MQTISPSRTGDTAEIEGTKQLIDAQIAAGYTSFAIDASHLFNFEGKNVREELEKNIGVTSELGRYIKTRMNGKDFGLEVEVGEIGRKDGQGMILTQARRGGCVHQCPAGKRGVPPGPCHCQWKHARTCV